MKHFLLFIATLAVLMLAPHSYLAAQKKPAITGAVADSTKLLSLVTVRLLKPNSSDAIQTTISKEDGTFRLNKPAEGSYNLTFTHTGFAEKTVPLVVNSANDDMQLETVQLSRQARSLKEVVVKTQRPLVETTDDKVVYNVEDDPTTKSETAIDILRKTPFVSVDGEDNIKVNGKGNFKVLLNGRETSMFANNVKEVLRGFPGTIISKIEVITSPSAKYDGEGVGGLINIITKKKVIGYNGTLSSFARTSDKVYNYSLNGNAKFGKFGATAFLSVGYSDPLLQRNISTTLPTVSTSYSKRILDGDQQSNGGWSYGNAELSYEMDSLNTVSLYTNIDSWNNTTASAQTITTTFENAPASVSFLNLRNKSNNPGISIGSDYIRHFKRNKAREFSLRFLGEFGKNDAVITSSQDNPGIDRFLMNNSHALNNQYTIQADNSIPLKNNQRIEFGAKAILRRASSDFESLVRYDQHEPFVANPANTDQFKYRQNVVGMYSMYNFKIKKSGFRVGMRAEYTDVNGDFTTSGTEVRNHYLTLLPDLQFTNRISSTTTLVLSYTKRLQRPYIYDLNPFVNNNDSLNISYGNPHLGPQTTHAISSQFRYGKGSTFAGLVVEGSYSGNKILPYSFFDPTTGITQTTSLNIGKEYLGSVSLNLSTKFTPKWSFYVDGSVRYSKLTNNAKSGQSNSGVGMNININTSYRFSPKFFISSYTGFWKDPQTIQTTYPFSRWHNIALNYKILKEKLNISLRAVNYYEKTWDYKVIIKDPNFTNTDVTTKPRRAAVLALTWNFGKLTENVSKKKGINNDDILTKPAAPGT